MLVALSHNSYRRPLLLCDGGCRWVSAQLWRANGDLSQSGSTREPLACRRGHCFQRATPPPRVCHFPRVLCEPALRQPCFQGHTWDQARLTLPHSSPTWGPTQSPTELFSCLLGAGSCLDPCRTPSDCSKLSQGDAQGNGGRFPSRPGAPWGSWPGGRVGTVPRETQAPRGVSGPSLDKHHTSTSSSGL